MVKGANIVGAEISAEGNKILDAINPGNGQTLSGKFSIATEHEIDAAVQSARQAFDSYKNISGVMKADFLDAIADEIMALGNSLIQRASQESALSYGRLEGERGRTCSQLEMFADLLRNGSWVDARINRSNDGPDIRNMLFPLGPVAVFGASNFPLAFSTAGGDTASALAAGCPVVVKSHESHLGTHALVSEAIIKAAQKTDMPAGVFNAVNGRAEVGTALISHPDIKAVGFTGSFKAGKAIFDAAQQREEPIPVYAEMGSVNPVFLLEGKLKDEAEKIATDYAGSVTLGAGQFCTNPGVIIGLAGDSLDTFTQKLTDQLQQQEVGCMLNKGIASNYRNNRDELFQQKGVKQILKVDDPAGNDGSVALGLIDAGEFLANSAIHQEVFGPFTLIVSCKSDQQMKEVAKTLEGQLTVTIMGNDDELSNASALVDECRERAGRIIFNGVPTGVAVNEAMHHGGPFPATTDSKFTSVGTSAIRRFVRPIAFQNAPETLLPDELKLDNPLDISRIENGEFTK